jgi:hypothetical protein
LCDFRLDEITKRLGRAAAYYEPGSIIGAQPLYGTFTSRVRVPDALQLLKDGETIILKECGGVVELEKAHDHHTVSVYRLVRVADRKPS